MGQANQFASSRSRRPRFPARTRFGYLCTSRNHHGRDGCDTPYVPAQAIDDAVVERLMAVAGDEQAQDQIVRMAIGMADEDVRRIRAEMDRVKLRLAEVQKEIGNLVRALKSMGERAVESVQEGLKECEAEKKQLNEKLRALGIDEQALASVTGDAERFLESWRRVRDLFGKSSPAVRREIVQAFIEELVWIPADRKGKSGTYRLKFFPEIFGDRPDAGIEADNGHFGGGGAPQNPPNTNENAPVLRPVRDLVRKARQVGLEPTTSRLTAGCSTIELLPKIGRGEKGSSSAESHNLYQAPTQSSRRSARRQGNASLNWDRG